MNRKDLLQEKIWELEADVTAIQHDLEVAEYENKRLRTAIREALDHGGLRWSEWGDRAVTVGEMLEKALMIQAEQ